MLYLSVSWSTQTSLGCLVQGDTTFPRSWDTVGQFILTGQCARYVLGGSMVPCSHLSWRRQASSMFYHRLLVRLRTSQSSVCIRLPSIKMEEVAVTSRCRKVFPITTGILWGVKINIFKKSWDFFLCDFNAGYKCTWDGQCHLLPTFFEIACV